MEKRFTFGQLSAGLQIILILILIGSCSGGSEPVRDETFSTSNLEQQISKLRVEVRRLDRSVQELQKK
jgi:hypothetical protein